MAPVAYSGALQPKKKAELQQIAGALRISDSGTREDLQTRIKKHLEDNQTKLEDEPVFSGLFGKRKKSVQPQPSIGRFVPSDTMESIDDNASIKTSSSPVTTRSTRRNPALEAPRDITPVSDIRDVSMMLKKPISPATNASPSTNRDSPAPRSQQVASSVPITVSRIANAVPSIPMNGVVDVFRRQEDQFLQSSSDMLLNLRTFLSNSRNVWSLTAVFELIYILYTVIPWQSTEVPLWPTTSAHDASFVSIPYPPLSIFESSTFWTVLMHWSIPSLFLPSLFGTLISFHPSNSTSTRGEMGALPPPVLPFDALTASIIRLAAQFAYPFDVLNSSVEGIDVIGHRWRVLNAAVGLAFALVEAIYGAPGAYAQRAGLTQHDSRPRSLTNDDTIIAIPEGSSAR